MTGTLGDPAISEAGRKFLADLLVQLTDQQVRDLFEVARVDRRVNSDGAAVGAARRRLGRRVQRQTAADCDASLSALTEHRCKRGTLNAQSSLRQSVTLLRASA